MTLYTFGYWHSKAERILAELIAVKIPLVEVRRNPTARNHRWIGKSLALHDGLTYYWLENLGNDLYQQESGAQIHDLERGLDELASILQRHERACSMCACAIRGSCYRSMIAEAAECRSKWTGDYSSSGNETPSEVKGFLYGKKQETKYSTALIPEHCRSSNHVEFGSDEGL